MTERGLPVGVKWSGPLFIWIVRNILSGLHHLSLQQWAMNVVFFVFPMTIAVFIYSHVQSGLFSSWQPQAKTGYLATKKIIQWAARTCLKVYYQNRIKTHDMWSTVQISAGRETLLVSTASKSVLRSTSLLCKWESGALCLGFEWMHRELTTHRRLVPTLLGAGLNCAQEELCCFIFHKLVLVKINIMYFFKKFYTRCVSYY